eukprot:2276847-Rhodomonas_salina.1
MLRIPSVYWIRTPALSLTIQASPGQRTNPTHTRTTSSSTAVVEGQQMLRHSTYVPRRSI